MEEINYYEAFGLEAPSEESANTEAATPSEDQATEGEKDQQAAEAEVTSEATEAPESAETSEGKTTQTPEENARYARQRREAEQRAAIEKAKAEAKAEAEAEAKKTLDATLTDLFKRAQLTDTFTDKPITNIDEFNAWEKRYNSESFAQDLREGNLDPEKLAKYLDDRKAEENKAAEQARAIEEQKRAQEAVQQRMSAEIAQIHDINPDVNTLADLDKLPRAKEFRENLKQIMDSPIVAAYKRTYGQETASSAAAAARQQTINSVNGRAHLTATTARGTGMSSVPADIAAEYRELMPGLTDAEIQKHYNQYLKK